MKKNKALIVVTNHTDFQHPKAAPTGLWLSELVHSYDVFKDAGLQVDIVSPEGGKIAIDERSLGRMVLDKASKARYEEKSFMALLDNTRCITDIESNDYDLVFFAGGHGAMWDFAERQEVKDLIRRMYENGQVVATVCHGAAALQDVKLSNGEYLIKGKKGTGFPYFDERLAGVKKFVPYNLQQRLKDRGMIYSKAFFPLQNHVVVDGNLVTGQNPNSTTSTAKKALEALRN